MSTLTKVSFFTIAGGEQVVTVSSFSVETELLFFNKAFDEAIDGSLRQNVRGTRKKFSLFYNKCMEPSILKSILNNIVIDLNVEGNNLGSFRIFQGDAIIIDNSTEVFNASSVVFNEGPTEHTVTLDSATIHRIQYANQIGTYVPKINMIETTIT
tara:strand:- start:584 stop:1048 length:465 start_codon:yes stop_codon:yes gene_type:complete